MQGVRGVGGSVQAIYRRGRRGGALRTGHRAAICTPRLARGRAQHSPSTAQACKGATTEFARISAAIRVVEEELKTDSGDGAGLAQWVRKLQQAEQSKLQLTIGTQVAVFSPMLCSAPCCAAA